MCCAAAIDECTLSARPLNRTAFTETAALLTRNRSCTHCFGTSSVTLYGLGARRSNGKHPLRRVLLSLRGSLLIGRAEVQHLASDPSSAKPLERARAQVTLTTHGSGARALSTWHVSGADGARRQVSGMQYHSKLGSASLREMLERTLGGR